MNVAMRVSQAATDDGGGDEADGAGEPGDSPDSDVSDGMLKQMKNASNTEKVRLPLQRQSEELPTPRSGAKSSCRVFALRFVSVILQVLSSSDQGASGATDDEVIEPPDEFLSPPAEFNDRSCSAQPPPPPTAVSLAEGHLSMSTSSEMTDSMFERNISNEAQGICGILENCESSESDEPVIGKEDVEATKEDVFEEEFVPEEASEQDEELDITQETLPDMGISIISTNSTVSTPDGESGQQQLEDLITGAHGCVKTPADEVKDIVPGQELEDEQNEEPVEDECNFSVEEERALEENANLILAEISNLSMDLSASTISDDLLEQETISLLSNTDYNSDTASEVSVSLSCSSKTMSDRGEISSSNPPSAGSSAHSTPQRKQGRPRILKPGDQSAVKPQVNEEAAKAVRGKRKPLYPGARSVSASPKRPGVNSTTSPRPVTRPPPKPVTPGQHKARNTTPTKPGVSPLVGKTPPKGPARASSAGQNSANKPLTTVKSRSSSANASTSSTDKNKSSPASSGIGQRTQTAIYRPASGNKGKTSEKKTNQSKSSQDEVKVVERPKPPIKQGTFTMESPTQNENIPSVSHDTNIQSSKLEQQNGKKRLSAVSSSSSRSSAELKYSNDSQEKLSDAVKLLEKRSSAASPVPAEDTEPKAVLAVSKAGSNSSISKMAGKTGPNKIGGGSRTSSGSSLNKSGASSAASLNKTSSGSSIKTSSKSSLNTSDSQSSLRKSGSDRSSTPPRKVSSGSNASGGSSIPPPNKKAAKKPAAVSRIASLWKKSDNSQKASDKMDIKTAKSSSKTEDKTKTVKSSIKSPKAGKRSLMPFKSNKNNSAKNEKKQQQQPKQEPSARLTRSGTYDKLPTNPTEAEKLDVAEQEDGVPGATAKDHVWRRTYTISDDRDEAAVVDVLADGSVEAGAVTAGHPPPSVRWRRHASESSANLGEQPEQVAEWRRTASTSESSPTDYSERTMVQFDGVWVRRDDSRIPTAGKPGAPRSGIPTKLPVPGKGQVPQKKGAQLNVESGCSSSSSKPVQLPVAGKPQVLDIKSPTSSGAPAAIVAPFNYTPSPTTQTQQGQGVQTVKPLEEPRSGVAEMAPAKPPMDLPLKPQYTAAPSTAAPSAQPPAASSSPPTKHMTKTEMLLERRRRSYLNSLQQKAEAASSSKEELDDKDKSSSCLVTTV